jgi:hypothetical protein
VRLTHYYWGARGARDLTTRTHPDLVAVVENGGKETWGPCAKLKVISIPFSACEGWEIDEYDGFEKVVQTHESWG